MAQTLKELLDQRQRLEERTKAQRDELDERIEKIASLKREKVIEDMKKKAIEYGIKIYFEAPASPKSEEEKVEKKKQKSVDAIYRNPTNGKTWSGRGLRPIWLRGVDLEFFKIKKESAEIAA